LYVALIVIAPTDVLVKLQLVAGSVAVQVAPVPSDILTEPVGVPPPGATTVSENETG
jgi:hypothetical protein